MAQRFGGKHSPTESTAPKAGPPRRQMQRASGSGRVNFLYLAPLPLLWTAFRQDAVGMAVDLAAAAVLVFAAFTVGQGIKAEAEYTSRKVARRPALPRKILAAGLAGVGVFLAAYSPEANALVQPLIYAVIAAVLFLAAFGLDPLRNKGMEGIDTHQQDRVARAVENAEDHLEAMLDAIKRAKDRGLERRVEGFQATARTMFRTVEEDPRDLRAAKKFLGVYLSGARDATVKFADLYSRNGDESAKADYIALLDDLEANFAARTSQLLEGDRTDLDIEIEVLRDRLSREGIRPD